MIISARRLVLALATLLVAIAVVLWTRPQLGELETVGVILLCAVASVVILAGLRPPVRVSRSEPDDIGKLSDQRRRELVRGTSLFLREARYRYSVRLDGSAANGRRAFTAEVNTIRLGFVPAIITDNASDRQGFGYVAFVHDGRRWRGPGLPCPAGEVEAVRHAARCVSPLEEGR